MANSPLDKKSLRVKAYQEIKNQIIFLDLKPGQKIFESEIAEKLKISRTPVREALLLLENEKLVECDPRLGFMVKRLTSPEVEEYFSIRWVLELYAATLIIERITDSEIDALRNNVKMAEDSINKNDLRNIIKYETEFHKILYKSTKSDIFFSTISGLIDKFQLIRAIAMIAPGGSRESVDHHKRILSAIEKKDLEELKKIMEIHLNRAAEYYSMSPAGVFLQ
jgi:DNA-binding GntR family transcriptional regulator